MKNEFAGKKIILGVPNHFGLPERFKENLEFLGFEVYLLKLDDKKIKLNTAQKITNFLKKNLAKDKTYRMRLTIQKKEQNYLEQISHFPKADYSLIIRPDLLNEKAIKSINEKVNLSCAYQWDGLHRFPLAKEQISFFDNFFVFDKQDVAHFPTTKYITNFYFDDIKADKEISQDLFFVGTFMKDRINLLGKIALKAKELNLKSKIIIIGKRKYHEKYGSLPITFTKNGLKFKESIDEMLVSKTLLDFRNQLHNGLSFRIFEALGYEKKLITNNNLVKDYDFYHPNNIFVVENENLEALDNFLKSDFIKIHSEIKEKYSFTNWIKKTLNLQ